MITATNHWNPEWYTEGSDFQCQTTKRILRHLDFTTGQRLLDIGCGDGRITRGIAEAHPHLQVVGLDQSEQMVSFAQKEHQAMPNLTFVAGDIQTFVAATPFDYIVSFWALSWLTDHEGASIRIRAALKPGGRCFLLVPTNNPQLFTAIADLMALPRWKDLLDDIPNPVNTASLTKYRALFPDCGKLRQERFSCRFKDAAALGQYVKGWLPHLKRLSNAHQKDFLARFVAHYNLALAVAGGDENTVSYDCVLVDDFGTEA